MHDGVYRERYYYHCKNGGAGEWAEKNGGKRTKERKYNTDKLINALSLIYWHSDIEAELNGLFVQ